MSHKIGTGWRSLAMALAMVIGASHGVLAGDVSAELKDKDGKPSGKVSVAGTLSGLLITIRAEGLAPGYHGVRFHETGKCDGDFSSAGGIYNPLGAKHGLLNEEGPSAGDLPNIHAAADGTAEAEMLSPFVHLGDDDEASLLDEDGTAILIFEKPDDHISDPDGGAGSAVLCGVLVGEP